MSNSSRDQDHHGHDHGDHGHDHAGHEHGSGVKGWARSLLQPHSHDAADSVDSALESSAEGIRAVKISLVALGVTAIAQAVVVVLTGSVALLADTIHNFSDALTAIPLWIAFVLGRRAATRRGTCGAGRAADRAPKRANGVGGGQGKRVAGVGKAVLLVEQRARAALQIADWTSVLVSGATRLEGRPGDLLKRQDFEELFLGAGTAGTAAPEFQEEDE